MINDNEITLYRILSGKIKCSFGYIVKSPIEYYIYANELYNKKYMECLDNDGYTQEMMVEFMIKNKFWTEQEENEYKNIYKNIDNLKVDLYNAYSGFANRDNIRKSLINIRKRRDFLTNKRSTYDYLTCEYFSYCAKSLYLIWSGLVDEKNNRVFREPFDKTEYSLLFSSFSEMNNIRSSEENIRQISKLPQWKMMWSLGKDNIFCKSVVDLTDEQLSLMMWSRFYDNIHESMDCPPDEVIDDDDMIDGWAIVQRKKREEERNKQSAEKSLSKVHGGADEIYVMADQRDVGRIYSLNDAQGRMIQKQNLDLVKKKGIVEEKDLPISKQKIAMEISRLESQHNRGG